MIKFKSPSPAFYVILVILFLLTIIGLQVFQSLRTFRIEDRLNLLTAQTTEIVEPMVEVASEAAIAKE